MGNKSSALEETNIIHPTLSATSQSSVSKMSKSPADVSSFSLASSGIDLDVNPKQLWLVRHGERSDEVGGKQHSLWKHNSPKERLFDPPLTANGFKQALQRGKLLSTELQKFKQNSKDCPQCIYASPTERTIGTAVNIALVLQLPIVIVPGLSTCAAAVKSGGLIRKKVNGQNEETKQDENDESEHVNDVDDYELFLEQYGWIGECSFLRKQQILDQFLVGKHKHVDIRFDYRFIESFQECVVRLTRECESSIALCVTHREGIRALDDRLKYSRIPYCGLAKYAISTQNADHSSGFTYFEN